MQRLRSGIVTFGIMTFSQLSPPVFAQNANMETAPVPLGVAGRPLPASPSNVVAKHGQLRVQGNRIVDAEGKPVALHGMSLFWSQWIGKYFNPDAVRWLQSDWDCTVVRAAMGVGSGGYLENPDLEKQRVIAVVDAAIERGIYVIIDWHDHEAQQHLPQAQKFFAEMAQRYAKYPNVIYETFNEPLQGGTWSKDIKPYHEAVIKTIRQHDPDNIIVCGTRIWSQRVDEAADDPIKMPNIAYTLHFYAASHKQWLRDTAQKALDKGIAIMVTEFGTTEASGNGPIDREETRKWFDFMDKHHISWANWSVADKNETSAALIPGATATGNWSDAMISPSGLMVRAELRAKNTSRMPVTSIPPSTVTTPTVTTPTVTTPGNTALNATARGAK